MSRLLGEFNHLPQAGGLYDQHPELIVHWMIISAAHHEYEDDRRQKEERKRAQKGGGKRGF